MAWHAHVIELQRQQHEMWGKVCQESIRLQMQAGLDMTACRKVISVAALAWVGCIWAGFRLLVGCCSHLQHDVPLMGSLRAIERLGLIAGDQAEPGDIGCCIHCLGSCRCLI